MDKNNSNNSKNVANENRLILIGKTENYMEFIYDIIFEMPKAEKYNLGNEYKQSMCTMLRQILYLSQINMVDRLRVLYKIDAEIATQRIFLRMMRKKRFTNIKKFEQAMELLNELGRIVGGLEKYYAKNYKKTI